MNLRTPSSRGWFRARDQTILVCGRLNIGECIVVMGGALHEN